MADNDQATDPTESQEPQLNETPNVESVESSTSEPTVTPSEPTPAEPAAVSTTEPVASTAPENATTPESADGFVAGNGPSLETQEPTATSAVVGSTVSPTSSPAQPQPETPLFSADPAAAPAAITPPQKSKKSWHIPALAVVSVVILVAAFFGFKAYTSTPNYVWNKSLGNTQKAYATLNEQLVKTAEFKGSTSTGKLSFTTEGTEITGDFKAKSNDTDAEAAFDLSMTSQDNSGNGIKLSAGLDMKAIGTDGEYPDLYVRVRDLDKLSSFLEGFGMSTTDINSMISEYNNQWYVLEGDYLQSLSSSVSGGTASEEAAKTPTTKDLTDLLTKVGTASSEYIFATEDGKAVLQQKEFVGKEQKNGATTYHYKASVNKAGLKAYGKALKAILADDATARSLMSVKDKAEAEQTLAFLDDISKDFKDNEVSIDIWVDGGSKLIQSIRLSDPSDSKSYVELAQLYTSGDELPIMLTFNDANTKVELKFTANTKTNENNYSVKANAQGATFTFTATESLSNNAPKIEKPSNAKSVEDLLSSYMGMLPTSTPTDDYLNLESSLLTN